MQPGSRLFGMIAAGDLAEGENGTEPEGLTAGEAQLFTSLNKLSSQHLVKSNSFEGGASQHYWNCSTSDGESTGSNSQEESNFSSDQIESNLLQLVDEDFDEPKEVLMK